MKYLSLFSGIGGFELGITQAYESNRADKEQESNAKGVRPDRDQSDSKGGVGNEWQQNPSCIGFSEIDKYAVQIYQSHFPEHKNYGDITKINTSDLPEFELLVGGFPCQAFSIAGKRGGFNDTRGTLFFEIARILKDKRPRLLLLENVKGLLSHEEGKTFSTIISTLDELGYDLQWQVLNSKNFGVPQNRERVFIVGHLRGTSRPEVFPFGEGNQERTGENAQRNAYCLQAGSDKHRGTYVEGDILQGLSDERATIRRLTPTECERLQGFPDGWTEGVSDTQRYKTLGNAVTVNVIREIIKRMI